MRKPVKQEIKKEAEALIEKAQNLSVDEMLALGAKAAAIAGGVGLAWELYKHRRLLLAAGITAGVALWVAGQDAKASGNKGEEGMGNGAPSFPGEEESNATQEPADEVDEALMESFPASDPPASYRHH